MPGPVAKLATYQALAAEIADAKDAGRARPPGNNAPGEPALAFIQSSSLLARVSKWS
jgi:hypothetical protein